MEINNGTDESATKKFQCTTFSKSYPRRSSVSSHIKKRTMKGKLQSYNCKTCQETNQFGKSYATKIRLDTHIRLVHGRHRFSCHVCFKTFTNSTDCRKHERIHLPNFEKTKYSCRHCSKTFLSKQSLQNHLFKAHKVNPQGLNYFQCELCTRKFDCRSKLEDHVLKQHVVDKAFECLVCSKTFIDEGTLDKHTKKDNCSRIKYFCDICSKEFTQKPNLIRHLKVKHSKLFFCNKCLRSFSNKSEFDQHSDPKTGDSELKLEISCQICNENFDSQCNLDIHTNCHLKNISYEGANANDTEVKVENQNMTDHLKITNPLVPELMIIQIEGNKPESPTELLQCPSCPKSYKHKSSLQKHIRIMHMTGKIKPYSCQTCFKNNQLAKCFATQSLLSDHKKRVHGPPRFKCDVCFRPFRVTSNFRRHRLTHLPNNGSTNTHLCEYCSKSFSSKQDLQNHLFSVHDRKTEGTNYFKCELCTREFNRRANLETHIVQKHVVDKDFKCPVCSEAFIDQPTLDKHSRCHDEPKKHFCDVCSKEFKYRQNLIHHLGVKHKQFFYCKKCFKSFSHKADFDEHLDPKQVGFKLKLDFKCRICGNKFVSQCNLDLHTNCHLNDDINSQGANSVDVDVIPEHRNVTDLKVRHSNVTTDTIVVFTGV